MVGVRKPKAAWMLAVRGSKEFAQIPVPSPNFLARLSV